MFVRAGLIVAASLTTVLGGCASTEDVRALRRPVLPPTMAALADRGEPLYRNVAIYEVLGAPEFRVFDGGALITTRPTRQDVNEMVGGWLADADMRAPNIREAHYLLTIRFDDVRGPGMVPFSDSAASSTVHYVIEDARTREIVFENSYESDFVARMPGVTPEMTRGAIAGALVFGAYGAAFDDIHDDNYTERFAAEGAAAMFLATAPAGRPPESVDAGETIGAFGDGRRRDQAVHWMMRRSFNQLLVGLEQEDFIRFRRAVPCADLNPGGTRGPAIITRTHDAVGYDCGR